ncbi:BQ2448_1207 [Microbotryum intermedium]|uniref:BQ2448_1207 protein n=1 Tax=Microbotryum intermedium TaxID=269621 RepID=A0A238FCS9_9BASI|nr:BQ2448_1207 [Microbotryum intermedium]
MVWVFFHFAGANTELGDRRPATAARPQRQLYAPQTRGKCMSMTTSAIGFSIMRRRLTWLQARGPVSGLGSNVFWTWGECCVFCTIFTYLFIPEIRQIDTLYRNSTPIKSNAFRKRIIAENMHHITKDAYAASKSTGTVEHKEAEARMH